jgi:alanine dehydrogenase
VETARPTTHSEPTYEVDGVVHYCVANMPGAVPITSTKGLTNVTLPYAQLLADHGLGDALRASPPLARGVNVIGGRVTSDPVARSHGIPYVPLGEVVDGIGATV